jgi:L-lactate dehydrogenase complex protein LldG
MTGRERIIERLKAARVQNDVLPAPVVSEDSTELLQQLTTVLQGIGGAIVVTESLADVTSHLLTRFQAAGRWVSMIPELDIPVLPAASDPHLLENVELSVLRGHFAVAENGAVWITADNMGDRALPFICEHIALVIERTNIVATMRHAYERIALSPYDFGTFIAGPSKTADIEQSLVLGAHGPKSLTLFVVA